MRRGLSVLVFLLAAVLGGPALAAPPPDAGTYTDTLTTEHFVVHFTGSLAEDDPIVRQWAGELAANAEWALETYASWGFPAPVDDGDGNNRIEVWVGELDDIQEDLLGLAVPIGAGATRAGYILVDDDAVREPHVIAHEVFHLVQFAMFHGGNAWFYEATAEWAALRLRGFPADVFLDAEDDAVDFHEPDNSIDCEGAQCGLEGYEAGGYSRWTFWQYLAERWGQGVVKEVWDDVAAHADPGYDGDDAIAAVLAGKGTTLPAVLNDYALALLKGEFQTESLKGKLPRAYGTVETPRLDATLIPVRVAVNRLATRFLQFAPPAQPSDDHCHPATLTLTVTLPSGVTSRPHFYVPATGALTALSVNGTTATGTAAWDTCSSEAPGFLSLPNGSATLDARTFVVTASVVVDRTRVVSAKKPPSPVAVIGNVIAAPTDDPAPTVVLYGPRTLRLLTTARTIDVVVFSSGTGRLHASLAGVPIGSRALRPGSNRLRYRLPRRAARIVASRGGRLELTAVSAGKAAWGVRTSQRVVLQKPKPKPKRRRP